MSDFARDYATWGSEVTTRAGAVVSGDLVAWVTRAGEVAKRQSWRLRGSDEKLVHADGRELAFPSAGGTLARLEDIGSGGPATTDELPEGSTNLYFTNARADARIAAASINDLSDVASVSAITGETGGGVIVRAASPTLSGTVDFTGGGTGVARLAPWASNDSWYALGLSGVVGASTYNLRSHPSTPHLEVNVPSGFEIRFRTADTIRAFVDSAGVHPASAGSAALGKVALGYSSLFLDEAGAGTQTAQIIAPTLTSDIVLTTPAATGTLALTSDIAATVDKAFVDALNVDADTLDSLDSTAFALASHVHAWADITSGLPTTLAGYGITDASPLFTDSAGLAALLSDENGSGGGFVRATSPTLTTPNIGAATGTSLALTGAATNTLDARYTSTQTSGSEYNAYLQAIANNGSASSANYFALSTLAQHTNANDVTGAVIGAELIAHHNGASTVARVLGADVKVFSGVLTGSVSGSAITTRLQAGLFQATRNDATAGNTTARQDGIAVQSNNRSPGTITELNGVSVALGQQDGGSGAGTITTASGFRVKATDPTQGLDIMAAGTITNWYGLKIDDPTAGPTYTNAPEAIRIDSFTPTAIGVRQVSTSMTNRFAGNTRFGADTAPTVAVDVTGSILASGNIDNMGGSNSIIQGQSFWFGGIGSGSRIRQNASANMVFSQGGTDRMTLSGNALAVGTTAAPAGSTVLDLVSTTGALMLPRMTTAQRDALTAANGMVIYNTTTTTIQGYQAGAWANL